jgi:hypothetical protein
VANDDRSEPLTVPPAVLEAFGSPNARPRVEKAWVPIWGFRKVKPPVLLTTAVAMHLRDQGVHEIELVWGRWHQCMTLLPGFRSVWGAPPPESGA